MVYVDVRHLLAVGHEVADDTVGGVDEYLFVVRDLLGGRGDFRFQLLDLIGQFFVLFLQLDELIQAKHKVHVLNGLS